MTLGKCSMEAQLGKLLFTYKWEVEKGETKPEIGKLLERDDIRKINILFQMYCSSATLAR